MNKWEYNWFNDNCEHASNMIIYGIEYSQQVAERPNSAELFNKNYAANKNKSNSLVLENEINRTSNQLRESYNQRAKNIRDQYKAQVEVSAKNGCKLM